MRTTAYTFLLGIVIMLGNSCESDVPDAPDAAHDEEHVQADSTHGHAAHEADSTHEAMPLRPIMQMLSAHMSAFQQALWIEDHPQMAEHANDIAEHAHISDAELQRIEDELGDEVDQFFEVDEAVHEASLRLRAAVNDGDMDAILERLHDVQVGCMSCHTRFRERLRTDQVAP